MKPDMKNIDEIVKRHMPSASREDMELDIGHVFQQLQSRDPGADCAAEEHVLSPAPKPSFRWRLGMAFATAAVLLAAFIGTILWQQGRPFAVVESVDGSLYRLVEGKPEAIQAGAILDAGETIRSNGGAGGTLKLADGSRVEMRSLSEFSVERAGDGIQIDLIRGSIIVNAAKQLQGHLYVKTKDVIVSVVGTIFLVNAEEEGSRVAVIEGEVRVQQGATTKNLLPGEQLATNPHMESLPMREEVSWSRNAEVHVALLQQPTTALTQISQREAFEVVSIRPNTQVAVPGARGGGGANNVGPYGCAYGSPEIDPRRFALVDTNVWTLIAIAYSGNPYPQGCADLTALNLISGAPPWVRSDKWDIQATIPEGSPSYTKEQLRRGEASKLRKMVLTLLEDRFQLVVRREMKEVPAYILTAEPGAPKFIVPSSFAGGFDNPDFRKYVWDSREPGASPSDFGIVAKEASLADVTAQLARATGRPVLDRTGITGPVSFILNYDPRTGRSTAPNLGQTFAKGLEQVGFKLSDTKTTVETWVIERVEKPSEN